MFVYEGPDHSQIRSLFQILKEREKTENAPNLLKIIQKTYKTYDAKFTKTLFTYVSTLNHEYKIEMKLSDWIILFIYLIVYGVLVGTNEVIRFFNLLVSKGN